MAEIAAMRRMGHSDPQIALSLSLPVSSVSLELRRLGLSKAAWLTARPPVVRYGHEEPGARVHLDTKKLGKIGVIGHRIHGDRSRCQRGMGWELLHVCIDDHSRLAYSEVLPDERGVTVAGFLLRSAAWLGRHGIEVRRVMTDNGSGYLSRDFRVVLDELGARHARTRPYTPRTNGKAERFIQTSLREWAYCQSYETSEERTERLGPWLDHYNNHKPHTAPITNRQSQE